jgi:glutamate formiminotransferase/formiminotetrahydrofolate cyclodeaminase
MKLVECVPNFSEGLDRSKIDQITREIETTEGVKLLDVDPGRDTNRTVVTFIGGPEAVCEAAFKAISKAAEVIDMSKHKGAHPRMGATDVCPIVPVSEVTMEECAGLAKKLGKRVGEELGIPVYLYEAAAARPERRNLADIRAGEYEALPEKLKSPAWKPDFGPARFNPRTGATVIGARSFLIAYNVNLNTRDVRIAKEIALSIRETGRLKKDANGIVERKKNGDPSRIPGKFKDCKAVGWYIEDFGRSQISINLVNHKVTPPHLVFDECCRLAEILGVRVTGSELVGLIPLDAMLEAGRHYLKKQKKSSGVPDAELVHTAVLSMGLSDLYPFDPQKKIIEYQVDRKTPLVSMTLKRFSDELSSDSPAPGGGSVAALCGALGSALCSMVAGLTHGKKGYETYNDEMEKTGIEAQSLKDRFLGDVDRDTAAFDRVMEAMRLPKKTDAEKESREKAMEKAYMEATRVPLGVLEGCVRAAELAQAVVQRGNRNSASDGAVASLAVRTAAEGAYFNILINLPGIRDKAFTAAALEKSKKFRDRVVLQVEETLAQFEKIVRPLDPPEDEKKTASKRKESKP